MSKLFALIRRKVSKMAFWQEYIYNSILGFAYALGLKKWKFHQVTLENGLVYTIREAPFAKIGADQLVIEEVWKNNVYSLDAELQTALKPTIIDVGAHIGVFSTFVAHNLPTARVYSFEALPANYKLLQNNISQNKMTDRIRAFNLAVADSPKILNFYVDVQNSGGGSLVRPVGKPISVQAVTLQQIFTENQIEQCDLLKMDIEGGEYAVLFNCQDQILNRIVRIELEHHNVGGEANCTPQGLKEFLEKKGFKAEIIGQYVRAKRLK